MMRRLLAEAIGSFFLFAAEDKLRRRQGGIFLLGLVRGDEMLQFGERIAEYLDVVLELGLGAIDEFGEFGVERVVFIDIVPPADRDASNAGEKAPGWVLAVGKEARVEHGYLENRDLQSTEQGFGSQRDVGVVEDEVEQGGDDVQRYSFYASKLLGAG